MRFREHNTVDHEKMIRTSDGSMIPESQLAEHNKMVAEAIARHRAEMAQKAAQEPTGLCPFRMANNCHNTNCHLSCAFYDGSGCILAASGSAEEAQGKRCPIISRECVTDCALYASGCGFVQTLKTIIKKGTEE